MKRLRRGVWGVVTDKSFLRVWLESHNPKLVVIEKERKGEPVCRSLHCSPCSPLLAVANVNELEVWEQGAWELRWKVELKGEDAICSAVFSPNGQRIATAGRNGMLQIWDVNTRECLGRYTTPLRINSTTFSPDGARLATANCDGTVTLLDSWNGKLVATFEGHTQQLCHVGFSPDGRLLASCGGDESVRVWDVSSRQCMQALRGHKGVIRWVVFAPTGRKLATASDDATVRIWDAAKGVCLNVLNHERRVNTVAIPSDGRRVAGGSDDGCVRVWDLESGALQQILRDRISPVHCLTFSADGRRLVCGGDEGSFQVWGRDWLCRDGYDLRSPISTVSLLDTWVCVTLSDGTQGGIFLDELKEKSMPFGFLSGSASSLIANIPPGTEITLSTEKRKLKKELQSFACFVSMLAEELESAKAALAEAHANYIAASMELTIFTAMSLPALDASTPFQYACVWASSP